MWDDIRTPCILEFKYWTAPIFKTWAWWNEVQSATTQRIPTQVRLASNEFELVVCCIGDYIPSLRIGQADNATHNSWSSSALQSRSKQIANRTNNLWHLLIQVSNDCTDWPWINWSEACTSAPMQNSSGSLSEQRGLHAWGSRLLLLRYVKWTRCTQWRVQNSNAKAKRSEQRQTTLQWIESQSSIDWLDSSDALVELFSHSDCLTIRCTGSVRRRANWSRL